MELSSVSIENFKKVSNITLTLTNINILVGANGCGKSSIIQGLHLACCCLRQAASIGSSSKVIPADQLDYLPTNFYAELGYNGKWGNTSNSHKSLFKFSFSEINQDSTCNVWCSLQAARNSGISTKGNIHSELNERFRRQNFTAYIPGISGIPNVEEKHSERVVRRACSFGDSNIYLRNVLLLLKENNALNKVEEFVSQIIAPLSLKINVNHNSSRDLNIACNVSINNIEHPIELIGTGYLQLIQIFAYIFLFKPSLLLIDEPDNHLHPAVQEKLLPVLNIAATEEHFKVILATHSPFIVRNAPATSKIYWLKDGKIENTERKEIELALGWGAFGKKIIVFSEDKKLDLLKRIIRQWPDIESQVAFLPGSGYKSLPTVEQAREIKTSLGNKYRILVYRDRDSMSDSEVLQLKQPFLDSGIDVFVPEDSDIEAYFCTVPFIMGFIGCTMETAERYLQEAKDAAQNESNKKFTEHRCDHNRFLYPQGGSPTNPAVWESLQSKPLRGFHGKSLFHRLKNKIGQNRFSEDLIYDASSFSVEIAPDLKAYLESVLEG